MIHKSIHIEEETYSEIEHLLSIETVQEFLSKHRKNAGENQLIRIIIKNGLPETKKQLLS